MEYEFKPELQAQVSEGWFAKESVTFLSPDGQANVIASSEPLDPSIGAYEYAEVQGELLRKEFPGFEQRKFGPKLVFGGRPGYLREFSWEPPDGRPVTQIQIYYAALGRGYTATATTPSTEFARFAEQLRTMVDALCLGPDA